MGIGALAAASKADRFGDEGDGTRVIEESDSSGCARVKSLHVDRADRPVTHRRRPTDRQSLFLFRNIRAPPDANRPQREEHCGSGFFRQDASERRIELRKALPRERLRRPPELRREKERVNAVGDQAGVSER